MNPHLQRALLLLDQSRFELAAAETRQALAAEPNTALAHAVLGLCLARQGRLPEATEEVRQAIQLAPDLSFAHYVHAWILHDRNRPDEAQAAVAEAIRLEPENADLYSLEAQIRLGQRLWPAALEAAERGLRLDPDHVGCTNLRAMALVKLGRKAEASATLASALAKAPEDSVTHANQGWALLHRGDQPKALEHFREALRLDPENEWARQGIVEALKARYFIYAVMLRYFLWMSRFSRQAQWAIVLGGYLGYRLLDGLARAQPALSLWLLPLKVLYIAFALLTWLAQPLFNLLLRLNRFGRLALSREQTVAANWVGLCLLLAVLCLTLSLVLGVHPALLLGALVFGLLALPTAAVFNCERGWPRWAMGAYAAALAATGLAALGFQWAALGALEPDTAKALRQSSVTALSVFLLGVVLSGLVANFLIMQQPKQ
ncbi:MAG: tetratricopeptide repeat protein [Verrucomicrobia bacterium]|nr:tetratricopeptide repeat protein [Verrucomicrobiota bacterium]